MPGRRPKLEIYKARNGQWSWRLRAVNGRKQSTAGETFARKDIARRAARRAQARMADARIVVL